MNPMLNQRLRLTLVFFAVLLLVCITGVLSLVVIIRNVPPNIDPTKAVLAYYNALRNKEYNQADTYFDPQGIIDVDGKGQLVSVKLIMNLYGKKSTLKSYNIVKKSFFSQNTVIVFADITRSGQNQPYEVHLLLQFQEGNGWKIIYVDGL
jgi:hypothetical protein